MSEASSIRGTGKASLPAPSAEGFGGDNKKKGTGKGKTQKDNVIGRGKPGTYTVIFCLASTLDVFVVRLLLWCSPFTPVLGLAALGQEDFLQSIRSGGIVSKV